MKIPFRLYLAIFVFFSPNPVNAETEKTKATSPYSLSECYDLSLQTSEMLKRSEEEVKIAEARYQQAISSIYPQVTASLEQRVRDNDDFGRVSSGRTSADDTAGPTGGTGGSIGTTPREGVLTVTQPLFTGFREFIYARAIENDTKALQFDLERNRELLYLDVALLYYQALRAKSELRVLEKSDKTFVSRIEELGRFRNLGKSRESEVLAARSERAALQATIEQTSGTLRATLELLSFLTGVPSSQVILDESSEVEPVAPIEQYLSKMKTRSDIKAAYVRTSAQAERVTATARGNWPRVDLVGNAYPYEDPDRNREWELALRLSMPIFDGGRVSALTDEEQARLRIANLNAEEKVRLVERDVRSAYERAKSSLLEQTKFEELVQAARKSYESQRKDYEFGVVSNLEVLQAIRQLQEAERQLVVAKHTYASNLSQLEVAVGGISK